MIPEHWKVLLEGFGTQDAGDVIAKDGEIIGTWSLVNGVFYTFTPDGTDSPLFSNLLWGRCVRAYQRGMTTDNPFLKNNPCSQAHMIKQLMSKTHYQTQLA